MKPKTHRNKHTLRMNEALALAKDNIWRCKGGPFGAIIYDLKSGKLLGRGVNRVVASRDPTAHAEINAIREACRRLKSYNLKTAGIRAALYTTAEPCGMCLTALLWAGISQIYCAATTSDVEALGFDEGIKSKTWKAALRSRGVRVACQLLRKDSIRILNEYRRQSGPIYNGQ